MNTTERQTGRTSRQMREAPIKSIFVWCTSELFYPTALARDLGRDDLQIVSPGWIRPDRLAAQTAPVVVDHAAHLRPEQWECVDHQNARARPQAVTCR